MFKRAAALALLLFLLMPTVYTSLAEDAADEGSGVKRYVVFYDAQTPEVAQTLDTLREFMTYSSWQCNFVDVWDAALWDDDFDAAVVCIGEEQQLPREFVGLIRSADVPVFLIGGGGLAQITNRAVRRKGDVVVRCTTESGNTSDILLNVDGIWMLQTDDQSKALGGQVYVNNDVYPLCQTSGNITHFAYYNDQQPLLGALLASCLQLWQWPYKNAPTAYAQYLVLDNVFPFLDLREVMERTEMLEDEGVPYSVAVTPIFSNGDYPSMKRFCEYLRYEQSLGVGIILRVPFVSIEQVDVQELTRHIALSYEAYAMYGVYPTAIEAPKTWLQCESGLEALRGFRTVFLFETDEILQGPAVTENIAYKDGHQIVAPAWEEQQAFSSSYAQAIYFDAQMDLEDMRTQVRRIKASKRVLKNLNETENRLYCGDYAVVNMEDLLQVNGENVDLTYIPFEYDPNYTFNRGIKQYFKDQIETSNRYLMVFVAGASAIFLSMIVLFRRQIRRELLLGRRHRRRKIKKEEVDRS